MAGARTSVQYITEDLEVNVYGEFAMSQGVDRKPEYLEDVNTDGSAFGGGLVANYRLVENVTLGLAGDFYHFDGAEYGSNGWQYSHGFVSFKGARTGGLALDRHFGWHSSAHIDRSGVANTPHDGRRSAGSDVIHAGVSVDLFGVGLAAQYWILSDTSNSFISQEDFDSGACEDFFAPFEENTNDYCASERFGEDLGSELDLSLTFAASDFLQFYTTYATFTPGAFYELEYDPSIGSAFSGHDPFWGITFGAVTQF